MEIGTCLEIDNQTEAFLGPKVPRVSVDAGAGGP